MSERAAPEKRNTITAGPGGTESASAASASPKKRNSHTIPLESQSRAFKGGRTKRRTDGIDGWMEYKVQEVSLLKQGKFCPFFGPCHKATQQLICTAATVFFNLLQCCWSLLYLFPCRVHIYWEIRETFNFRKIMNWNKHPPRCLCAFYWGRWKRGSRKGGAKERQEILRFDSIVALPVGINGWLNCYRHHREEAVPCDTSRTRNQTDKSKGKRRKRK